MFRSVARAKRCSPRRAREIRSPRIRPVEFDPIEGPRGQRGDGGVGPAAAHDEARRAIEAFNDAGCRHCIALVRADSGSPPEPESKTQALPHSDRAIAVPLADALAAW